MQLHAGMIRTGEAAVAQCAGWHTEVAAIFLHHHVGGHLGCTVEGMFALVDAKGFADVVVIGGIGVASTAVQFSERNFVWGIA